MMKYCSESIYISIIFFLYITLILIFIKNNNLCNIINFIINKKKKIIFLLNSEKNK